MDYEKKYNDALKKAKSIYRDAKEAGCSHIDWLEHIFPELTESEDERVRKDLIDTIHHAASSDVHISEELEQRYLAYLEKQKEPIPIPDKFSGLKSLMLQYHLSHPHHQHIGGAMPRRVYVQFLN